MLGFHLGALGASLVLLARDFDVSVLSLTWLSAGFGVSSVLLGLTGPIVLRLGAERLVRVAAITLAAGGALIAVAPTLPIAQIGAGLLGIGGATTVLCTPALVVGAGMARRLTVVTAASSVTGVIAPLMLGAADRLAHSGRLALLLPVPFALALAIRRLPDVPAPSSPVGAPTILRRRVVVRGWLAMVLGISAEFGFLLWGAARLVDAGLGTAAAAAGAAAFPIGMAVTRTFGSALAGRARALQAACGCAAAGAALVALPFGPIAIIAGLAVGGVGAAFLYPMTLSVLLETSQLPRHRVAPVATTASGVAVLFGPALLREVADVGGLQLGFLVILPLMAALVAVVPRSSGAESGEPDASPVITPLGT